MSLFLNFTGGIINCDANEQWSNAELKALIKERTKDLITNGPSNQKMAIIAHDKLPGFFIDLIALWNIGFCVAVVNPKITQNEKNNIINFLSPDILIEKEKTIFFKENFKNNNLINNSMDDKALILFTSGTTGSPKAVVHSFRSLISRITLNSLFIRTEILQNSLCLLPFHFGHGLIGNCLSVLFNNGNLHILKNNLANLASLDSWLHKYKITFLSSVPSLWKNIFKLKPTINNHLYLKRIHIGSAPLSSDLWEEVVNWSNGTEVINAYGITETANWVAGASSLDMIEDGLIGKMWGGYMAIFDKSKEIKLSGEGEIIIKTPSIMQQYLKNQKLTEEVFVHGWYRTGDIGYLENNKMKIIGRSKSEINRAGLKVNPEEIDILIEKHELVYEACVFGAPDDILGEKVCVAIVPSDKKNINFDVIKLWLKNKISSEKIPEKFFILDMIPKNDRGKINRKDVYKYCFKNE